MSRLIEAAICYGPGAPFVIQDVELEAPRGDEVLVRIAGVGICHTDLLVRDQVLPVPLPLVLGHEGSGVVEAVGELVTDLACGDEVVLTFVSCGLCEHCERDDPAYCERFGALNFFGARTDGSKAISAAGQPIGSHFFGQSSFGTYAMASRRNAIKVESPLPLHLLGPLGCGIQTGAGAVMRALDAEAGSSLAVFGGGAVGLSAVMAAGAIGCTPIIVVEPHAARRMLARALGATHVIDPGVESDVAAAIRAIAPGGVHNAVEATGKPPVIEAAIASVRKRGACALVGAPSKAGETFAIRTGVFMQTGVSVFGVMEGDSDPATFIPELLRLNAAGRFPFEKLITTYPFSEIERAVADQKDGSVLKPVLRMP